MNITLFALINATLGLIFGSFITMASHRIPSNLSMFGRSKCTSCGHKLGIMDLIPIVSMFMLKGKCRYCDAKVSIRYICIELLTGVVFALNALIIGNAYQMLMVIHMMAVLLILILVIDFETFYIPDGTLLFLGAVGVLYSFLSHVELLNMIFMPIINALIAFLISWMVKIMVKKESMGSGDIKLFLIAGLFLTPANLAVFYLMTGLFGIMIGVYWKERKIGIYFPFGPAICISLYWCALFGDRLDLNAILL